MENHKLLHLTEVRLSRSSVVNLNVFLHKIKCYKDGIYLYIINVTVIHNFINLNNSDNRVITNYPKAY